MTYYKRYLVLILILGFGCLISGAQCSCGNSGEITTPAVEETPAEIFGLPEGELAFYSFAMDVAPVITPSISSSMAKAAAIKADSPEEWGNGDPTYELFMSFRDYQYPRDDGIVDVSNMHKFLFEAGNFYNNGLYEVQELPAQTAIPSPFDFGRPARAYSHASNHAAMALDGTTTNTLLTFIWDESPKFSYGIVEGNFDATTGDLELDFAYLVDYEGDDDYCVRTWLSGNENTHRFVIKSSKYGTHGYSVSIIGAGIAKSDDPEDYFIVKMIDNIQLHEYTAGRYYKFPSSPTDADLINYASTGYLLEELDDPRGYAQEIDRYEFFPLDGSQHATSVADFTNIDLHLEH